MKFSMILMSAFTTLFLVNCSTHPEIKPYEETSMEETSTEESLPYGQAISDSVFSDSTIAASDDSSVPTEFDDRIDSADEDEELSPAPKKEVVVKKEVKLKSNRVPASVKGGGMKTFSSDCIMKSEPNDASENVGNVAKGKKLWLDTHDATWFKAYKKSGTVYVPSSCVQ